MNRNEAKAQGLSYYRTGKPCKHGHIGDRYVSTTACVACVKRQSTAWKLANPEAHRKSMRTWLENNRALQNERTRAWQRNNPDKARAAHRAWAKNNPEKTRKKAETYRAKNPAKITFWAVKAQIKRRKRVPAWLTENDLLDMRAIYVMSRLLTEITQSPWEVDHILPLQGKEVSGLHVPSNLQILPKDVNRRKRNLFLA
jgi:hypothetical protein